VLPAVLGALLAFGLAVLLAPPTVGLGRGLVRYEREQHALVRLAMEARSAERRRVAAELHDGVNLDLTGVGYALNTLDAQILGLAGAAPPPPSALRRTLGGAARLVHDNLLALRELTGLRYAADSGAAEPAPALRVGADELRAKGARITTEIGPLPPLPQAHRAALIRAGREALRNAVQHAPEASTALRLGTDPGGGAVVLTVADDGPGFDPLSAPGPVDGRIGLALLGDAARGVDGRLDLRTRPGQGTTVRLVIPVPRPAG
jgi:signal transduction histidine kinase